MSTFHSVSFQSVYYAVNSATASVTEADAVLTWVPAGCTATQLNVFSRQSGTITVILRHGTPGAMADTTMSCQVASGASCAMTGSVAVAAGNFLDFIVSGASGTAAGVWTALQCD
jgi:hypothetical protein